MAETIYINEITEVKEKIILLKITRKGADGNETINAKAFKSAEPYLKVGEKVEADVEHQPANGSYAESWLVKPVADRKATPKGGGGRAPQNDASIAAQVILKEVAITCRLDDKVNMEDMTAKYTKAYTDAYTKLKGVHGS